VGQRSDHRDRSSADDKEKVTVRVLGYFETEEELSRVTELLESRGIPVYPEGVAGRFRSWRWCLFVCINDQFEDAVALLKNENHDVRQPVDVAAFKREAEVLGSPEVLKNALIVLLGLVLLAGAIFALRYFLGR
jgi:hypothetical protein